MTNPNRHNPEDPTADRPAFRGDAPLVPPPAAFSSTAPLREDSGTRIGPYKLLQLIGEGGFGSVFLAEQEKPVQRKVALKIIKLGMDTNQVVARFAYRLADAMLKARLSWPRELDSYEEPQH